MDWMAIIGNSIQYIEEHLTEEITPEQVAKAVHVSPFYFQKGFAMLCGYTMGEYIRNRRMTLAGNDLLETDESVLEIALKYRYESPDSFAKTFTRFCGASPSAVRRERVMPKSFAPLKIKFSLVGGYAMDYKIVKKEAFTVLANLREFPYEGAKQAIPRFWQEHFASGKGTTVYGQYGINMDVTRSGERFEYLIADDFDPRKDVPEGFTVRTIPAFTWAVFPCKGALPTALQSVNQKIYTEWLPQMKDYEFSAGYCVEYYSDPMKYPKGTQDENYVSELWIPVKKVG